MDFEQVKELIDLVDQSSLTEFEFEKEEFSVRMSKNNTPSFSLSQNSMHGTAELLEGQAAAKQETGEIVTESRTSTTPVPATEKKVEEGRVICSPIVGVAYLKPTPDSEPYVSVGDAISEGQIVCLVEAMKIMNEIKSDFSGKITEILIENEQVVEYNQPLFRIV